MCIVYLLENKITTTTRIKAAAFHQAWVLRNFNASSTVAVNYRILIIVLYLESGVVYFSYFDNMSIEIY